MPPLLRNDVPATAGDQQALRASLVGSPVARLQPRTVGQLLDGGFEVLRFRFRTVAAIAGPIVLPLMVLPQVLTIIAGGTVQSSSPFGGEANPLFTQTSTLSSSFVSTVALGYLSSLGLLVAQMLVGVGIGHLVTGWLMGVDRSASDTLKFVLRRSPVAIGAFLVALLIKAVAAIPTCGVALLFVVPMLAVLAPVVAAEPVGVMQAISRTSGLARRRLGPVLGICVLWWMVSGAVSAGASLAAAAIGAYVEGSVAGAEIAIQGISVATSVFLLVVQVSVTVLVYIDLRVRTEGLDLEFDATELLGVRPAAGGAA